MQVLKHNDKKLLSVLQIFHIKVKVAIYYNYT